MDQLVIRGQRQLKGEVAISGAKNAEANMISANAKDYSSKTERMIEAGEIARSLNDLEFVKKHPKLALIGSGAKKHAGLIGLGTAGATAGHTKIIEKFTKNKVGF